MGVHWRWHDEAKSILVFEFEKAWAWEDIYHTLEDMKRMNMDDDKRQDIVADFSAGNFIPQNALSNGRGITRTYYHDNIGIMVIVSTSAFMKAVNQMFRALNNPLALKSQIVPTFDDALRVIEENRAQSRADAQ